MDVIASVGELTDLRDKDDLEVTLARVTFDLVGAAALRLWRAKARNGEDRLNLRAKFSGPETPVGASSSVRRYLRLCLEQRRRIGRFCPGIGMFQYVFPVFDQRCIVCLLELTHPSPLNPRQERIISGLLRVYKNHLGVIDFSDSDELTGLLNRRTFDEVFRRLSQQTSQSRQNCGAAAEKRNPSPVIGHLAVADIDYFKRINDSFGHPYGDEVLVLIARRMAACLRETDKLFRFGGEEFVVLLPGTRPKAAEQALERLRIAVETFDFPQIGQVTISIGSTRIGSGDTGSVAYGRADEALYVAKKRGRNQRQSYERLIAEGGLKPQVRASPGVEFF